MSLKRKALAKVDDNVAEPAAPPNEKPPAPKKKATPPKKEAAAAPAEPAAAAAAVAAAGPKKKKAKKVYDGPTIGSYVDRDLEELPLWITSKAIDPNDRIKGLTFAVGGLLITRETATHSFHITLENFKVVLASVGAKLQTASPNSKTDIFIEGNIAAERTKTEPDKWSGSGKQVALQGLIDKNLEQPILVLSFQQFLTHFNLEHECYLNSTVADFSDQRKHANKPPGSRTRGDMFGVGLQWTSGPLAQQTVLAKHNPHSYPYVQQFPNEALGFRGPRTAALGAAQFLLRIFAAAAGGGGRVDDDEEGEDEFEGCG